MKKSLELSAQYQKMALMIIIIRIINKFVHLAVECLYSEFNEITSILQETWSEQIYFIYYIIFYILYIIADVNKKKISMCKWNKNIFFFFSCLKHFPCILFLLFSFQIVKPVIIKTVSYPKNVQNVPELQWGKRKLFILGFLFFISADNFSLYS